MRLGADPEVFLINRSGDFVSSVGKIPGTKEQPHHISGMPPGFTVQQDNVALEFGIPPAANAKQFAEHIASVLAGARRHILPKGLSYATAASCVSFPKSQLNTAEANIFGCEPDFNAWTGKENPRPEAKNKNLRSCGGHLHVETQLDRIQVVRAMDVFLGLPSLFEDVSGSKRRELYGMPGAYRPKPYGVEYRTLSNYWVFSPGDCQAMFWRTQQALDFVMERGLLEDERVPTAIRTSNVELAAQLMQEYGV